MYLRYFQDSLCLIPNPDIFNLIVLRASIILDPKFCVVNALKGLKTSSNLIEFAIEDLATYDLKMKIM